MTDLKISVEGGKEDKKTIQDSEIKETLKAADDYSKLKQQNDMLETELLRQQELMSKIAIGGRALAGQVMPEKTDKEKADDEARELLSHFR